MSGKNQGPSGKELREIALVLLLGTIFALLAPELLLRLSGHNLFSTRNLILRQLDSSPHEFEFDPQLAWVPVKSKTYVSPPYVSGLPFKITLDDYGLRVNPSPWGTAVDRNFRILAVGDSFTFGNEVSDEETWPSHLQELLKVQVINGGVPMYGFDQVFLHLKPLVDRVRPAIVAVSITSQSVGRTAYSGQIRSITHLAVNKPYFAIEKDDLRLMNVPVEPPKVKAQIGWFRNWFGRSFLVNLLMRRFAVNWWLSLGTFNNAPPEFRTGFSPADVSCRILRKIDEFGRRNHFVPFVVGQVYWQDHSSPYQPDPVVAEVYACAKKLGWAGPTVEDTLHEIYDRDPLEYDSLYLPWAHMTNRGNLLVAQHIAPEITALLKGPRCASLSKDYGVKLPCDTHWR
jgi:hypothetical protein